MSDYEARTYGDRWAEIYDDLLPSSIMDPTEVVNALEQLSSALPRSALREGDHVIDAEGRLRSRDVDVLRIVGDEVVVRSGLAAGERVCISALQSAIEGMRVRIAPDGEGRS